MKEASHGVNQYHGMKYELVIHFLRSNTHLPKRLSFPCFNQNSLKLVKNAFYFILKAFVLTFLVTWENSRD